MPKSFNPGVSQRGAQQAPASAAPVRVLCVDDNYLVAEGVAIILSRADGLECVGQIATADELVRETRDRGAHIVLLDIDLPGRDPFDALKDLASACPEVRTIMFSGCIRSDFIDRAVECGAWGYLGKGESAQCVIDAIERVLHGEFVIGQDVEPLYSGPTPRPA